MLCDARLYAPQREALQGLVEVMPQRVAEPTMAGCAAAILAAAPPRFLLAGTSFGGSVALEIAATAPERVAGLWLMGANPGPAPDPAGQRRRAERVESGEYPAIIEEFAAAIAYAERPEGEAAAVLFRRMAEAAAPQICLAQNAALMGRADRRPDLSRITCPTRLLWGREDQFVASTVAEQMAATMPRSRLVLLEGCGHLPTLERAEEANEAARHWIAEALALEAATSPPTNR